MATNEMSRNEFSEINSRTVIIKTGFTELKESEPGRFRDSTIKKGKKLAAKHVFNVEEIHEIESGKKIIRGRCLRQTSIRKSPYYIELIINNEREIISGFCSCHGGAEALCKHSSAIVHFINSERTESKTAESQTWHVPSKASVTIFPKGKKIKTLYNVSYPHPTFYNRKNEKINKLLGIINKHGQNQASFYKLFSGNNQQMASSKSPESGELPEPASDAELHESAELHETGTKILETGANLPESAKASEPAGISARNREEDNQQHQLQMGMATEDDENNEIDVQQIRILNLFNDVSDKINCPITVFRDGKIKVLNAQDSITGMDLEFYTNNIKVTKEKAIKIFKSTIGQSSKTDWFKERKPRISASQAYRIWKARTPDTRYKSFDQPEIDHINLRYGRETEPEAIRKYEFETGNNVLSSGLVIKQSKPYLCGSPDGIIFNFTKSLKPIILEVKCPISKKDSTDIDMDYIKNGKLKKNHIYYGQCQLNMYVANADLCHFFLYSKNANKLIEINRDDDYL